MKISSYSKVFNIGHPQISELLEGDVTVEEKVDGSQLSFGHIDGAMFMRSNGKNQTDATDKMFLLARDQIETLDLHKEWVYRGEYLNKPKHNTLCYGRMPEKNIILFDIDRNGQTDYMPYEEKAEEAKRIGLEIVPLLHKGKIANFEEMMAFLDRDSVLGDVKIEGFVIKNYNRWTRDGKTMMGKFVSEAFKEKHDKDWKNRNPNQKGFVDLLREEYRTEARWRKAVQHLKEAGELSDEPKDIGPLMKELHRDFDEECSEEIGLRLFKHFRKALCAGIVRGFPDWYKKELAKGQFIGEAHEV